jgi:hypothetical protein
LKSEDLHSPAHILTSMREEEGKDSIYVGEKGGEGTKYKSVAALEKETKTTKTGR